MHRADVRERASLACGSLVAALLGGGLAAALCVTRGRIAPSVEQYLATVKGEQVIVGAHSIIYSKDADADRAFLRDVIGLPNVDVGGGWLIFGLPPSEVAFHPSERNDVHEFYLMCDDVEAFIAEMSAKQITCTKIHEEPWGRLTEMTLPGGGKLGVYQPLHARPPSGT